MPESDSSKRLRRSALAFSVASRIGILAVLGSLVLLLATPFRGVPSIYWRICFTSCVLALGILILGYLLLSWNSLGYGFDGSHILTYLFWLLILCGFVSASFGFATRNRFIVLVAFSVGSVIGVGLTPLFHYLLVSSIRAPEMFDKDKKDS
jgi:hypothetical protein